MAAGSMRNRLSVTLLSGLQQGQINRGTQSATLRRQPSTPQRGGRPDKHSGLYRGLALRLTGGPAVQRRLDAPVALQGLSDECRKRLSIRGRLSIESLEHSNAIVLGSVLAKLELPLDSLDWHLEGDN